MLGVRAYRAHRAAKTFLKHDEKALRELSLMHRDKKEYLSAAKQYIAELEELIQSDDTDPELERDAGWDIDSLREEVNKTEQ